MGKLNIDISNAFANEANEFLYKKGYNSSLSYFIGGYDLDFYPEQFYYASDGETKVIHPNGKKFKKNITNNDFYLKYKKFICELLKPIMIKYNITIDDIR